MGEAELAFQPEPDKDEEALEVRDEQIIKDETEEEPPEVPKEVVEEEQKKLDKELEPEGAEGFFAKGRKMEKKGFFKKMFKK